MEIKRTIEKFLGKNYNFIEDVRFFLKNALILDNKCFNNWVPISNRWNTFNNYISMSIGEMVFLYKGLRCLLITKYENIYINHIK